MALQKQVIPIQLGEGLDEKTDPKQVIPGKMLTLENSSFKELTNYRKRNGFTELADVEDTSAGFITRKQDLLVFASGTVKKYNPNNENFVTTDNTEATAITVYDPCRISSSSSITGNSNVLYFDSCVANNVRLVAWVAADTRWRYQLFDATTGSSITGIIRKDIVGTNGIKTIAVGNFLAVFWAQGTDFYMVYIDSTDPSFQLVSPGAFANLNGTSRVFDVCVLNGSAYVVYFSNTASIIIQIFNPDMSTGASKIFAALDATFGIAIAADVTLNEIWVSYVPTGTSNAAYFVVDDALTTILTSTDYAATSASIRVETPAIYVDNGSGKLFYTLSTVYTAGDSNEGFLYTNNARRRNATRAGSLTVAFELKNSTSIISKPFTYTLNGNETVCILVGYNGHSQGYAFVINEFGDILAKVGLSGIASGYLYDSYNHLANGVSSSTGSCPEVISMSDTVLTVPILEQTAVGSDPNVDGGFTFLYGVNIITLDFNNTDNLQFVETSTEAHITGGFLGNYDGNRFTESGFMTIPEPPQRIVQVGGSSNFTAGTYSWVLVYEWFDAQNNLHQSAVSEPTTVVIGSNQASVNMTINANYLSYKNDNTFLSVYGTEKDGDIYYRLTAVPTNTSAAVSDNYNAGAGRSGFPQLYTTGGELDNDPMPAPSAIFKYRNRVFIVPCETPNTLWYSKGEIQGIPGSPISFSAFLTYQVNTSNGNTVTGVQIDDKCVLFKPASIFYFAGDGPNDTGSGNDFTPAVQVPSAVGTNEPRSVVGFQNGAIFKSMQGWYLIDRSLTTSYIGADVEDHNDATVVSATLLEDSTEIRIVLSTGVALKYDWLVNRWCEYTNYAAVTAGIFDNKYTRLLSNGKLIQENTVFSDNGQYIAQKWETGWLSFAGFQSLKRIYKFILLGEYISPHALRISVCYDFNPNPFQTIEFSPDDYLELDDTYGDIPVYGEEGSIYGGISFADYPIYQFRMFTTIQKCESIKITIEEVQTTEIGEGFSLSGLAFEAGVEGGVMRVPAVRSFG